MGLKLSTCGVSATLQPAMPWREMVSLVLAVFYIHFGFKLPFHNFGPKRFLKCTDFLDGWQELQFEFVALLSSRDPVLSELGGKSRK